MSPEQALARRGVVDQRTDIYSLGVTLYELLTLQPAFDGRDHQELLRQIALDEPVSPRRLNPAVPARPGNDRVEGDGQRPVQPLCDGSGAGRRFTAVHGRPAILARRPGVLERTLRWARRHKRAGRHGRRDPRAGFDHQHSRDLGPGVRPRFRSTRKSLQHEKELAIQDASLSSIESYPVLHQLGSAAIAEAGAKLSPEPSRYGESRGSVADASAVGEILPAGDRAASQRPGVAGSHRPCLLATWAMLHWMLSIARATEHGLEPQLLAEAIADYRRSVDLLEKLLADSPGDPKIRRYLAEALGLGNMGCCLRMAVRTEEAESLYRRSIQIRRELLRGTSSGGRWRRRARTDAPGELEDLLYLVSTVHLMAGHAGWQGPGGGSREPAPAT